MIKKLLLLFSQMHTRHHHQVLLIIHLGPKVPLVYTKTTDVLVVVWQQVVTLSVLQRTLQTTLAWIAVAAHLLFV